jgi:hypothetical protein
MRRTGLLLGVLLGALAQGGCVERFLAVQSDPPGAAVYVDGEKVGTTPCEVSYVWYGTRVVLLELRGYSLVRREVVLNPPWWQLIPIDLVTDVLVPFTIRDRQLFSAVLEEAPVSQEQVDAVVERAAELRAQASASPATPSPKE